MHAGLPTRHGPTAVGPPICCLRSQPRFASLLHTFIHLPPYPPRSLSFPRLCFCRTRYTFPLLKGLDVYVSISLLSIPLPVSLSIDGVSRVFTSLVILYISIYFFCRDLLLTRVCVLGRDRSLSLSPLFSWSPHLVLSFVLSTRCPLWNVRVSGTQPHKATTFVHVPHQSETIFLDNASRASLVRSPRPRPRLSPPSMSPPTSAKIYNIYVYIYTLFADFPPHLSDTLLFRIVARTSSRFRARFYKGNVLTRAFFALSLYRYCTFSLDPMTLNFSNWTKYDERRKLSKVCFS